MLFRGLSNSRTFLNFINLRTRLRFKKGKIGTPSRRIQYFSTANAQCPTVGEVIEQWSQRFKSEGIPEPVESIEHIVAHVIGIRKPIDLINVQYEQLTSDQYNKLDLLCECRLSRMPVQYIIGEWDFRDITLKLIPPVFIPRPETEILVDFALKRLNNLKKEKQEVLEIGCGSGAISLALAHSNKTVNCTAIDRNEQACELTKENRNRLGLEDQVSVVHATLKDNGMIELTNILCGPENLDLNSKTFDIIISNPPYIPTKQIFTLTPEIKLYEDIRALDGGEDGLKIIKPLLKYSAAALKPGGCLLLEVDPNHPQYIMFFTNKFSDLKLQYEHTYKDFCNNDRFVEVLKVM